MKKLILLTQLSITISAYTQSLEFICGTIGEPSQQMNQILTNPNARATNIPEWQNFVPNQNSPERIIRLNFHFIGNTDGSVMFTESSDNDGILKLNSTVIKNSSNLSYTICSDATIENSEIQLGSTLEIK